MPVKELKIDLTPALGKLDVYSRRDILSRTMTGEWATVFKGRGIEFAGFRAYVYGDDASMIDWKASLRSKETLIREFEEFKNFTVFFLFDVSDTMLFSSGDKLKCEYAAELIYVMADAINKAGDSVGMSMFNDSLINKVYPNIGAEVMHNIKANLLNSRNYGGLMDIKKVLRLTASFVSQKAVLIIVSDFLGFEEGWEKYIRMLSDDYEIIGLMISDPRDLELPASGGQFMLKDPLSGENLYVDVKKYAGIYKEKTSERVRWIHNLFIKSKGDFLSLRTDEDYLIKVIQFFERRSKRTD